ncbi:acetyltransferase [bacterium 1XD8-76]|nr:acetyltransferase [bacterium 1XD8-76]
MKPLYIIGSGGLGREVAWQVERINKKQAMWDFKGFIDDNEVLWNTAAGGYPVLGGCEYLGEQRKDLWTVAAVGNSKAREKVIQKLELFEHIHYATLVDPSVVMSEEVSIGEGSIICVGTIITTNIRIGNHCVINPACTVGHDAVLSEFVTLYPGVNVSGNVKIQKNTEIGAGSVIIQGIKIGSDTIVGANSTVINDIEDEVTVVGSPAKVIKKH